MIADFARRLRSRDAIVGYWVVSDNPPMTERIARAGYDYICVDLQHGLLDYAACLRGLVAVDAGGGVAVVRVPSNDAASIGRALDAGAGGVIVPLVDSAEEAAAAVRSCRYPPTGIRSYGPTRSSLRVGPDLRAADESVACIVMIETLGGLADVDAICAVPGVDAVYIGPSDLAIALGASNPGQPRDAAEFAGALGRVRAAAERAGIAAGLHCTNGRAAADALRAGFTFASVSNDLDHLEGVVTHELGVARS